MHNVILFTFYSNYILFNNKKNAGAVLLSGNTSAAEQAVSQKNSLYLISYVLLVEVIRINRVRYNCMETMPLIPSHILV